MPSMNDSSEPVDTSSTRTPGCGRSPSERASASSTATALRLSLAPGTTSLRAMSAIVTVVAPASSDPQRRRPLRPRIEPSATNTGPSHVANMIGSVCVERSSSSGKRSANSFGSPGWKISPLCAASWWATTTTVSSAFASPISATTLNVSRWGSVARRNHRLPPPSSSQIAAAAPAPIEPASRRARREPERSAASPATVTPAFASPNGHQKPPWARSTSTDARCPCARIRSAIHSAARRSPCDAEGRS